MTDDTRSIIAELEADADPHAPLCPRRTCREPLVKDLGRYQHGDLIYHGAAWLCHNTDQHGGRPGTAALYFDWELPSPGGEPFGDDEIDALETIIDTETRLVVGHELPLALPARLGGAA